MADPLFDKNDGNCFQPYVCEIIDEHAKKYLQIIGENKDFYDAIRETIRKNERD